MVKRTPSRTCIGCRRERHKSELLRFVLSPEHEIVLDYNRKLPGRGCYACVDRDCIRNACKCFRKAFRMKLDAISYDMLPDILIEAAIKKAKDKIVSLLSFAIRARKAVTGSEAVDGDIKKGNVYLLINFSDLSESAILKWKKKSTNFGLYYLNLDINYTMRVTGKNNKVVGVKDRGLGNAIIEENSKITKLDTT